MSEDRTPEDDDALLTAYKKECKDREELKVKFWKLQTKLAKAGEALEKIGNDIGGPTMSYDRAYENKELIARMKHISKVVIKALREIRGGKA